MLCYECEEEGGEIPLFCQMCNIDGMSESDREATSRQMSWINKYLSEEERKKPRSVYPGSLPKSMSSWYETDSEEESEGEFMTSDENVSEKYVKIRSESEGKMTKNEDENEDSMSMDVDQDSGAAECRLAGIAVTVDDQKPSEVEVTEVEIENSNQKSSENDEFENDSFE